MESNSTAHNKGIMFVLVCALNCCAKWVFVMITGAEYYSLETFPCYLATPPSYEGSFPSMHS